MKKDINKRVFYTFFAALTISGFIVICTLGQSIHHEKVESKIAAAVTEPAPPLYTVREYNGKIAVFRLGRDDPYMTVDYEPMLLSEYDRTLLSEGIGFYTEKELKIYLQDIST